jgi:MFS family permease
MRCRFASCRWLVLALYLTFIYAFLPFGREVVIALGQRHYLGLVVTALYFVSIVGIVYYLLFNVRLSDRVAFAALVVLAVAVGSLVLGLSVPEERVHFVEYGVLALLARAALAPTLSPPWQYLGAWLVAALAGWGDELIQGVLHDRFYDLRDVCVNAVAALLALAGDEVLHDRLGWRWTKDGHAENPDR